jgi:hypothetical protein
VGGELPNRAEFWAFSSLLACRRLRDLITLFLHLIVTVARLAGPGGARSVVAESVLVKHQLLILNRSRIPGQLSVRIDGSGIVEGVSDATAA